MAPFEEMASFDYMADNTAELDFVGEMTADLDIAADKMAVLAIDFAEPEFVESALAELAAMELAHRRYLQSIRLALGDYTM